MSRKLDAWFAAALALGLGTLLALGLREPHADEDACVAIGWLLARGWRLYSDVFSHHMPLDYLPSWALASVFGPSALACRLFMIGAWAAGCGGLYALARGKRELAVSAVLFTALSAQWMTYWMGQLMLVESYWGWAVLLLLVLLEAPAWSRARATAAGALLSVLPCASPTCAPAFLLLAWAVFRRGRPAPALAGLGAFLAVFLAWALAHADAGLWYADAVRFNAWSYAAYSGLEPGHPLGLLALSARESAAYFARSLAWTDLESFFEGVLRLAVLARVVLLARRRDWASAAWWAALVLALRLRPERYEHIPQIHGAPFFMAATWLFARGVVEAQEALQKRSPRLAAAWAGAIAAVVAATLVPTTLATSWVAANRVPARGHAWLLEAVKKTTGPDDPILSVPIYPRLYVDAARVPATPSVFYLPWQAAWPPERERTLKALRERPPKLVFAADYAVWGVPWRDYAADLVSWIEKDYVEVRPRDDSERLEGEALYVRRDQAAGLLGRCPACILVR